MVIHHQRIWPAVIPCSVPGDCDPSSVLASRFHPESHRRGLIVKARIGLPPNADLKQDSPPRRGFAVKASLVSHLINPTDDPVKSPKTPKPKTTDSASRRMVSAIGSGKAAQNCGKPLLFSTPPSDISHAYTSKSHEPRARQRRLSASNLLNDFSFETP